MIDFLESNEYPELRQIFKAFEIPPNVHRDLNFELNMLLAKKAHEQFVKFQTLFRHELVDRASAEDLGFDFQFNEDGSDSPESVQRFMDMLTELAKQDLVEDEQRDAFGAMIELMNKVEYPE